jgi:hypothetical protein
MINRPIFIDSCGTEADQFYFVLHFSQFLAVLFALGLKRNGGG